MRMARRTIRHRFSLGSLILAAVLALFLGVAAAASSKGRDPGRVLPAPTFPTSESLVRMLLRERSGPPPRIGGPTALVLDDPDELAQEQKPLFVTPLLQPNALRAAFATRQTIGRSFDLINYQDQLQSFGAGDFPPDCSLGVSPEFLAESVNGSFGVFDRSGNRLAHLSLTTFFGFSAGGVSYPRNGIFDPRIRWDNHSGRWFGSALEGGVLDNRGFPTQNHVLLAVSRTGDPTGIWDKYVVPVGESPTGSRPNQTLHFTDYDTLGVDDHGIYLGVRIFPSVTTGTPPPTYAKLVAIPKGPLLAPAPSLGPITVWTNITDMYATPQPADNADYLSPGDPTWFVSSDPLVYGNIKYRTLTWSAGLPTLSASADTVLSPTLAFPPLAPANGSTSVNTGDIRLLTAEIRNGQLWTCRNVGLNSVGNVDVDGSGVPHGDRCACEWLQVGLGSGSPFLVQSGRLFDTDATNPRHYYYPSVLANGQGHMTLCCSGSKTSEFIGAFLAGRLTSDPPGQLGTPFLLKSGDGPYTKLDHASPPRNRWGDFSFTALDPLDDMSWWTVQSYANRMASVWSTRAVQLLAPAPTVAGTSVTVTPGQTGVVLPVTGSGFYEPGILAPQHVQVRFAGGADTDFPNLRFSVDSTSHLTITFNVAPDAAAGVRDLVIINPDGQSVTAPAALTVSLPPGVRFSSSSYTASRAGKVAVISVQRTGDLGSAAMVDYATADGTAMEDVDYTAAMGTLLFSPGQSTRTFPVPLADDARLVGPRTVQLALSNASGVPLATPSAATLTLTDDTAAAAPTGLAAAASGFTAAQLSWTNHCPNADGIDVERQSGPGSFTLVTTLAADATSYLDSALTPGATYVYRLRARAGTASSDYSNSAAVTPAGIAFTSATYTAAEAAGTAVISVVRTGDTSGTATVGYSTADGTATAPADYGAVAGTLTFGPGVMQQSFTIPVVDDSLIEGPETVQLRLSSPAGAGVGDPHTATLTLLDDTARTAPTGLAVSVYSSTQVGLTWVPHSTNQTGFRVERQAGSSTFTQIALAPANATSIVDNSAQTGVTYVYRVRATTGAADSDNSNLAQVTIGAGARARITPGTINFGTVRLGKTKKHVVTIQNQGKVPLMGTVGPLPAPLVVLSGGGPFTLAPKKSLKVTVAFQPTAAGTLTGQLAIGCTDSSRSQVAITLKGRGR